MLNRFRKNKAAPQHFEECVVKYVQSRSLQYMKIGKHFFEYDG